MLSRRIIPCLDVRDGRVVKGVRFRDHADAGDIVECATRYRDARGPLRFMYEGSVVRRPRGRARRHRQVAQAGIECVGWAGVSADAEVLRATLGALDALGLRETRVELAHAGIAAELLRGVHPSRLELATEALSARDTAALARILGPDSHEFRAMERALSLGDGSLADLGEGRPRASSDDIATTAAAEKRPSNPDVLELPFKEAKAALVESFERDYLVALLARHRGNISRAASEAGIDRNYIHRLVKKYGLEVDRG